MIREMEWMRRRGAISTEGRSQTVSPYIIVLSFEQEFCSVPQEYLHLHTHRIVVVTSLFSKDVNLWKEYLAGYALVALLS
jgi:hypothetical protein